MKSSSFGKGRVAVVTGATGIIGPAICATLRRDGWRVAACASSRESFVYYEKVFPKPLAADARFIAKLDGRESCHRLVRQIERKLGPVAVLANNAAVHVGTDTFAELSESHVRPMVEVGFLAPLWLTQAAEKSLIKQRGCVINISSIHVQRIWRGRPIYPAVKAALETLTSGLALEFGPHGVRVNCLRVGAVPGQGFMRDELESLPREKARRLYSEIIPRHRKASAWMSATDRAGLPEDVGEAVAFLASPRAEFFNGATLPLDGGFMNRWDNAQPPTDWDAKQVVREWLVGHGIKGAKK